MLTEYFLAVSSLDILPSQSFKMRSRKSIEYARPIGSSVKNDLLKIYFTILPKPLNLL